MRFSPDGRYVAYDVAQQRGAAERDIFVMALARSTETTLVKHPADDRLLGWSPDGKYILFSSDRTGAPGALASSNSTKDASKFVHPP
jgi:tricorn protease